MNYLAQQGWGAVMGLWWIIGLVIFFSIIFFILKTGTSRKKRKKQRKFLKERFNHGEIDKTEYERQLHDIAEKERLYQH
jgi:uncharacterized membrane protein